MASPISAKVGLEYPVKEDVDKPKSFKTKAAAAAIYVGHFALAIFAGICVGLIAARLFVFSISITIAVLPFSLIVGGVGLALIYGLMIYHRPKADEVTKDPAIPA